MPAANDNIARKIAWSHVELTAGTVTAGTIETMEGVRALPATVGTLAFFIDLVDLDGGRLALDSCGLYEEATELAEVARADFDIDPPVRDLVLGDH